MTLFTIYIRYILFTPLSYENIADVRLSLIWTSLHWIKENDWMQIPLTVTVKFLWGAEYWKQCKIWILKLPKNKKPPGFWGRFSKHYFCDKAAISWESAIFISYFIFYAFFFSAKTNMFFISLFIYFIFWYCTFFLFFFSS